MTTHIHINERNNGGCLGCLVKLVVLVVFVIGAMAIASAIVSVRQAQQKIDRQAHRGR